MKRLISLSIPLLLSACSWIDDVGTVEKKGSYTFTPSVESISDPSGAASFANDSIKCMEKNKTVEFDVFDVNALEDSIWQIIMYDEVRDKINATMIGIDFQPWPASDTSIICPSPEDLVGSSTELSIDGCVRANLYIGSCSPRQTYAIIGSLTLDDFSTKRRETVSGSISGSLQLVQYAKTADETTRTTTTLGSFDASFQFPVHVGSVWMH